MWAAGTRPLRQDVRASTRPAPRPETEKTQSGRGWRPAPPLRPRPRYTQVGPRLGSRACNLHSPRTWWPTHAPVWPARRLRSRGQAIEDCKALAVLPGEKSGVSPTARTRTATGTLHAPTSRGETTLRMAPVLTRPHEPRYHPHL